MHEDYKARIISEIDQKAEQLWGISTTLFNNPELSFKEFIASRLLCEALAQVGYKIESPLAGLETAFRAVLGDETGPTIAILAEYDALIGLGHACGHNLIAAAALGAGMALAVIKPQLPCQIQIIGTPAEEDGGGKILLANAGVFTNIDAAMMFHPGRKNLVLRSSLASSELRLEFFGKASHAAAAPEDGINALDALVLTFNNLNALRPTLGPKDRVAGIITNGGEASNIIPAYTSAEFTIRSLSGRRRDELIEKVIACAQAGAMAVGCQIKFSATPGYTEIIPNHVMAGLFKSNLEAIGRKVVDPDPNERMGSTDLGDVSHLVPAIHPYLAISPENISGHTLEFKQCCISEAGKAAMLDAAKAMAMTAADLVTHPALLQKAREELNFSLKSS